MLSKSDEDRFYERMYLAEELEKMLNHIYRSFLEAKLSDKWASELLPEIKAWVGKSQSNPTKTTSSDDEPQSIQAFDVNDEALGDRPPWESAAGDDKES